MSKNLVIVESPAKAKTIEKYLGKEFQVLASYGHVRDLVPKEGAVDPENNFAMKYDVIDKNSKHVDAISRALKKADALYLATDPDREGEAISWHLTELLRERKALNGKPVYRVVFYEITKNAVREAIANPKDLSDHLVNAQQARRALDYLVGFNLSPLLWKKIRRGLSAGRVQSPALRLIVERELEIEAFNPREYWTVDAQVEKDKTEFTARLAEFDGEKIEQFTIGDEDHANRVEKTLKDAAKGKLLVAKITKKQRRRNPTAPFTTSTLQQEASRKLGFGAQRTMRTAQKLYEGLDTGSGPVGLITYMRTDSVSLAADAIEEIRAVIVDRYGKDKLPDEPRAYKTKAKNAQEAHEAIRPTSVERTPDSLKGSLDSDQLKLYGLIWKRTMACQMTSAIFDTVAADLVAGEDGPKRHRFRANGSVLVEPGFMSVYQEGQDDKKTDDKDRILPPMEEGDRVNLKEVLPDQHFTEPPPRYTEASLVKALEEFGIGRPSTYASIISTLVNREYVELDRKRFTPTDIGRVVNNFLTNFFTQYVDYDFTANMEDELDAVSRGEEDWQPLLERFWGPFAKLVAHTEENVSRDEAVNARELGTDPKSGKPMSVRMGRYGPFVQIGTRDDEDKPKFAGLRPGQRMDSITFEEAIDLFKLPRKLGETADGDPVSASIGRFGPYVRYGNKFVSIRGEDDPYTIQLKRALELIEEKKIEDANRLIKDFPDEGIQILRGRYGPYVTNKEKNARVPKDREPESLTLAECQELLEKAPVRGRRKKKKKKTGKAESTTELKQAAKKVPRKKAAAKKKKKKKKKKAAKKKTAKKKTAKKKTTRKKTAKKTGSTAASDKG
ncbi:MAG: DNA topoisomerase I [Gammaproteobacteria bacterium]|nr:DNA topoisomerase I [Gammaproteobacteria bacterium]NNM20599.1 DNA topoisomerase I [Gammaproteobacteria bacterium]